MEQKFVKVKSFGALNLIEQLQELDNEVNRWLCSFSSIEKVEIHDLLDAKHGEKSYTTPRVPLIRTVIVYFSKGS